MKQQIIAEINQCLKPFDFYKGMYIDTENIAIIAITVDPHEDDESQEDPPFMAVTFFPLLCDLEIMEGVKVMLRNETHSLCYEDILNQMGQAIFRLDRGRLDGNYSLEVRE